MNTKTSVFRIIYFLLTDYSSVCKVQNLSCKLTASQSNEGFKNTGVTPLLENRERKKSKLIK